MFERRHQPLLPRKLFFLRLARHAWIGLGIIAVSLGIGIDGYHCTAGLG